MKQRVNISTMFPKYLFWDMDYTKLNLNKDKDIIIPRAMYATTTDSFEKDIQKLEKLYSKDDILFYLKNTKELVNNQVCLMVSKRYKKASFMRFNKV